MSLAEQLRRVLDDAASVQLAVLFGSAARGSLGADSDIDVAVSLPEGADRAVPALAVSFERALGRRADVVLLDDAPPLLRFEIARDGVLLIERRAHAWAEFRTRAMIDWWDWAPTARMMHRVMAERLREEARRGPA